MKAENQEYEIAYLKEQLEKLMGGEKPMDILASLFNRLKERDGQLKDAELAHSCLNSIQALLDDGGIPRGTFADDQVRNLVTMYNQQKDQIKIMEHTLRQTLGAALAEETGEGL